MKIHPRTSIVLALSLAACADITCPSGWTLDRDARACVTDQAARADGGASADDADASEPRRGRNGEVLPDGGRRTPGGAASGDDGGSGDASAAGGPDGPGDPGRGGMPAPVDPGCAAQQEVCDGRDNDCDGTTDEGCPAVCGDGVRSGGGAEVCDASAPGGDAWTCSPQCAPVYAYHSCASSDDCGGAGCHDGTCTTACVVPADCPIPQGARVSFMCPEPESDDGLQTTYCVLHGCNADTDCPPAQRCAPVTSPGLARRCAPRTCASTADCGAGTCKRGDNGQGTCVITR